MKLFKHNYKFNGNVKLRHEYTDDKKIKWYTLKKPLIFSFDKEVIIVPKDLFYTDLASIPRLLHWIYKPNGKYTRASVLHDYLYTDKNISRFKADFIFLKAMKCDEVYGFTRWVFFLAVRLGGRGHKS